MTKPLKIAIIAGEESGDLLGADLIAALARKSAHNIDLIGVGGHHLERLGLKSMMSADEIALMGLGAILAKLPKLLSRISSIAKMIAAQKPDCLVVIDSPEFTHRVAKKVKKLNPDIPVIKYIAPSVWAWRPKRAADMRAYIDHVLVILPFEEKVMRDLGGPPATYVGHRLVNYPPLLSVVKERQSKKTESAIPPKLVILPGSRRFEIDHLMADFGQTVALLVERLPGLEIVLPTLKRHEARIMEHISHWKKRPVVVTDEEAKWQAFANADAALAASGTVSLELALCAIPTVLSYKADLFSRIFILPHIHIWSAALPNIIVDQPIVPEYFNEFVRPGMLARQIERLLQPGAARQAQMDGFLQMRAMMKTDKPSGELAAEVVLNLLKNKI